MSKIILKNIGRGKVNKTIEIENPEVKGKKKYSEEELAEVAYKECDKAVMSRECWLEPDDVKGLGFYKFYVGMGYHVGDVEIIL